MTKPHSKIRNPRPSSLAGTSPARAQAGRQKSEIRNSALQVHLVQQKVIPGQPQVNTAAMLTAIESARAARADLVVFPEMAIPGYLIGDGWERDAFLRDCEACGERLREASEGLIVVFGNVAMDWDRRNEDGRVRKYNALFVAQNRRFLGPQGGPYPFVIKVLQPNYRAFDESRYFYDLRKLAVESGRPIEQLIAPVVTDRGTLGCVLCEDAWDDDYGVSPVRRLGQQSVDLLIAISCSPFTLNKNRKRTKIYSAHALALRKPLIYVNTVGIQNDGKTVFTFDGASCVYDGTGHSVSLPAFEEDALTREIPLNGTAFGTPVELSAKGELVRPWAESASGGKEEEISEICRALLYGIGEFLNQGGLSRVVVGISGGIDSAVVAALFSRVLEKDRLLLANLPGPFTSPTTMALARRLAETLGCYYAEMPIADSVAMTKAHVEGLDITSRDGGLPTRLKLTELMMENVQARDRSARLLAALAAAFGGVFTCNANKAEITVGYSTLYGDLAGFLAPIADLWKGEVYQLGRYLNETVFRREVIPKGCFKVTPSAELSPAQNVDEGQGDPLNYPYHDRLFASWVEGWHRTSPEEILEWYQEGCLEQRLGMKGKVAELFPDARAFVADLERWWGQYQGMGVAKRIQAPPILAVKKRAFGFDHRESQMAPWFSRRYQELKEALLHHEVRDAHEGKTS